jgi:CHAD domain-containing protein
VRVAAGRLSVWLELAGFRVLRDDLRWLRRSAGTVRDCDIVLASSPAPALVRRIEERCRIQHRELSSVLASERVPSLLAALSVLPPLSRRTAKKRVRRLKRRVLRAGDELARAPTDLLALHRLRRRLRRLRYALEWLDEKPKTLEKLQDAFGALNDTAVTLRALDASSTGAENNGAELSAVRAEIERRLGGLREGALDAWARERRGVEAL